MHAPRPQERRGKEWRRAVEFDLTDHGSGLKLPTPFKTNDGKEGLRGKLVFYAGVITAYGSAKYVAFKASTVLFGFRELLNTCGNNREVL